MTSEKAKEHEKNARCFARWADKKASIPELIEEAFDAGQAAKEAELNSQPRSPEPIEQTRARFAREFPDDAEDAATPAYISQEWDLFARGAGHPRGTPFKEPEK